MDYTSWNNALGEYFFNEEKSEQEVFLFITKFDIVNIGKEKGVAGNNEEIFLDYINAIKFPNSTAIQQNPIYAAIAQYKIWNDSQESYKFPLFIGYLVLFIFPLLEKSSKRYNRNNYYARINDYFYKIGVLNRNNREVIKTSNFLHIDELWDSLESWSWDYSNTELGYFELHPFSNTTWVHVGKPLSQCLFSEKSVRNLNKFYEAAGIIPHGELNIERCRSLIIDFGTEHLFLNNNIINTIRDKKNELGDSILKFVIRHYKTWNGETDYYDEISGSITKGFTLARLKLCCEHDHINSIIRFYYRIYSSIDYPDDLTLHHNNKELKCFAQRGGWSNPINIELRDGLSLEDNINRWKVIFPEKNVRILIRGSGYHLSDWVESEYMSATAKMLLLAHNSISESIKIWGQQFEEGKFLEITAKGLPENFNLFECQNPDISHPDISNLKFNPEKSFIWKDGLKVLPRNYLPIYLPSIEIENGKGNEIVYMDYGGSKQWVYLKRKDVEQPIWEFPQLLNIKLNRKFKLRVQGENINGDKYSCKIIGYNETQKHLLKYNNLIPRDIYGSKVHDTNECDKIVGFDASNINNLALKKYIHHIKPGEKQADHRLITSCNNDKNDTLLYFLSEKEKCTKKDFFSAFEIIYFERFNDHEISEHNILLATLKRWSLGYYKYMGFIDNANQSITTYPPQLINVPTCEGRKLVFLGSRTPKVCTNFIKAVKSAGYEVNAEKQCNTLSSFLLPNTITITAKQNQTRFFDTKIRNICNEFFIEFNSNKYPAFELAEFSGSLKDYSKNLNLDQNCYTGWKTRNFDSSSLIFKNIKQDRIDENLALLEYQRNEYTYEHQLYINGESYKIDKNWGRYFILDTKKMDIILFNRSHKNRLFCEVIVPATVPIPDLINKALICCSGKAPRREFINHQGSTKWCNIYFNVPFIFASNYFKKLGQTIKQYSESI